jgi:nitrile hydratase
VSRADPDAFRRVPGYLRGHVGVVVGECGDRPRPAGFRGVPGDPEPVLTVRFPAAEVFGATGEGAHVHADLWLTDLEET